LVEEEGVGEEEEGEEMGDEVGGVGNASEEDGLGFGWVVARVVCGRLVCVDRGAGEVTLEVRGGDGVLFEEDFGLPLGFGEDLFEEFVDFLDKDVRVVLLDNTVIKIVRDESREVWKEEDE
jgi:hypothetical protein